MTIYVQNGCKPVNREEIRNLAKPEDIRPGAIVEFCDMLDSRQRVAIVSEPYIRHTDISGSPATWFHARRVDTGSILEYSMKDHGIAPIAGEQYHLHHWTELVQAAG